MVHKWYRQHDQQPTWAMSKPSCRSCRCSRETGRRAVQHTSTLRVRCVMRKLKPPRRHSVDGLRLRWLTGQIPGNGRMMVSASFGAGTRRGIPMLYQGSQHSVPPTLSRPNSGPALRGAVYISMPEYMPSITTHPHSLIRAWQMLPTQCVCLCP